MIAGPTAPTTGRRGGRARTGLAVGTLLSACAVLAGCSSSSSTATTTGPATTTTTSAAQAALQPKLLTVSDFPKGWIKDTSADAASTAGTPGCLANVVNAQGAATRVHAVYVGPNGQGEAAIQTVATFAPGQATASVAGLKSAFLACDGTSFTQGKQTAHITARPLDNLPTGAAGFAAEMELALGTQHVFVDVFVAVKGDLTTTLVWRSPKSTPVLFAQTAAKALDRL